MVSRHRSLLKFTTVRNEIHFCKGLRSLFHPSSNSDHLSLSTFLHPPVTTICYQCLSIPFIFTVAYQPFSIMILKVSATRLTAQAHISGSSLLCLFGIFTSKRCHVNFASFSLDVSKFIAKTVTSAKECAEEEELLQRSPPDSREQRSRAQVPSTAISSDHTCIPSSVSVCLERPAT